jgi:predicted ATPase
MARDGVRSLRIEGFTSIRSAEVQLGDLNVLVGANGSGKSNFIRALELLGRIVDQYLQLFVGLNGGASALLHQPVVEPRIKISLDAEPRGYGAVLTAAANDQLIFTEETVWLHGEPRPHQERLGEGHRETRLHDVVAEQRGLPPGSHIPVASYVLDLLAGCRVFHFHDTSVNAPPKRRVSMADNINLRTDGGNLASYLLRLSADGGPAYRQIVTAVRQVAPFFQDFVLEPDTPDTLLLRWRQVGSDAAFSANQLSDGTLRFICLATLLLSPELPKLLVLDEPELGLHPYAIVELAEMLRLASLRSQVVVATQSVTLMNQFELSDLIVVERRDGASVFSRPDVQKLQAWLADYSLGELWEKNMIGGRPGPELPA